MDDSARKYFNQIDIMPVSVIVSYSIDGEMLPLYVRIHEESYKIISAIQRDGNQGMPVTVFKCEIQDGNYKKNLELSYYKAYNTWGIKRN